MNPNIGVLTVPKSGSHRPIPAHVLKFDFLFTLCVKSHPKYFTYVLILIQIFQGRIQDFWIGGSNLQRGRGVCFYHLLNFSRNFP